jgi:hypothetical protein
MASAADAVDVISHCFELWNKHIKDLTQASK